MAVPTSSSNQQGSPKSSPRITDVASSLPGRSIGSYRIGRQLGSGGMGTVFEAIHESTGQKVAVKVLHPQLSCSRDLVNRFFNEARIVSLVHHEGLVHIFDFGQLPDNVLYIIMEYLEGESLQDRLRRLGGLQQEEAARITRQLASALVAAHDKGVIHRDIKPANVLLTPDPDAPSGERARLLDFGVAKILFGSGILDPIASLLTKTGAMIGTPAYMAPEQCKAACAVDDKADVYSLGVVAYEMLAGRPPFLGRGMGDLITKHMLQAPPPIRDLNPSLPADLAALVDGMLRKEPARRPTMAAVSAAMKRHERGRTGRDAEATLPFSQPPGPDDAFAPAVSVQPAIAPHLWLSVLRERSSYAAIAFFTLVLVLAIGLRRPWHKEHAATVPAGEGVRPVATPITDQVPPLSPRMAPGQAPRVKPAAIQQAPRPRPGPAHRPAVPAVKAHPDARSTEGEQDGHIEIPVFK